MTKKILDSIKYEELALAKQPFQVGFAGPSPDGEMQRPVSKSTRGFLKKGLQEPSFSDSKSCSYSFGTRGIQSKPDKLADEKHDAEESEILETQTFHAAAPESSLPESSAVVSDSVTNLQDLLSQAYQKPILITAINELPQTKKQVKEVYFMHDNLLSKVWVFKTDPEKTWKELVTYHIIYNKGIPTGKPLYFDPKSKEYPFDIAVIGGILEHAGPPYKDTIKNIRFVPDKQIETGMAIARLIAEYQHRITEALVEFETYGITLPERKPSTELSIKWFPALGRPYDARLGAAADRLYSSMQGKQRVFSHGDLHLGNIVTMQHQEDICINEYGFIDWEDMCLDSPTRDITDFFMHFRYALQGNDALQKRANTQIMDQYSAIMQQTGMMIPENDFSIQRTLWNLYEMFDSTRKDPVDIEKKAIFYGRHFLHDVEHLITQHLEDAIALKKYALENIPRATIEAILA
jgi:hypothetical protein